MGRADLNAHPICIATHVLARHTFIYDARIDRLMCDAPEDDMIWGGVSGARAQHNTATAHTISTMYGVAVMIKIIIQSLAFIRVLLPLVQHLCTKLCIHIQTRSICGYI